MYFTRQIGLSASEDRLQKLIGERLLPGSNKAEIDARIWDLFGETWTVMFTDLSGFSRGVASFGIIHFLQIIQESERLLIPCIDDHDGILLKTEGDSLLVIFRNAFKALDCSLAMQGILKSYNGSKCDDEKIHLCVGLGYGRMLRIGDRDVYGAETNAASKLGEDTAKSGEILVTDAFRAAVADRPDYRFESIDAVPSGAKAAFKLCYEI